MLVVTGHIVEGGRQFEHGEEIPQADDWAPHIRKMHLLNGSISDVTEEKAAEMAVALDNKRRDAARAQALRDLNTARASANTARGFVNQLEEQLGEARLTADRLTAEADEAGARYSDFEKSEAPTKAEPAAEAVEGPPAAPLQSPASSGDSRKSGKGGRGRRGRR